MNKLVLFLFLFLGLGVPVFFVCLPVGTVFASTTTGTIDSTYKYAWADKAGWLNFGLAQGQVTVTDSSLTGYVWSENFGWINLNPSTSGVKNNGEGTLSGYAWGELSGWINFSGVVINSSGEFTGAAVGDIIGTVNFNSLTCQSCKVITDWRAQSVRGAAATGGGGGIVGSNPKPPFSFSIDNGQTYTNNSAVTLQLSAGSDVKRVAISESAGFEGAGQEDYQSTKKWVLSNGDGKKTIYVKFYTQDGHSSEALSSSIILKTQPPEIKITNIKDEYGPDEDVILGGTTEGNAEISFYLDQNYGSFQADKNGQWLITLGKLSLGEHKLELTAHDFAGNSSSPLTVEFSVEKGVATPPLTSLPAVIQKIAGGIKLLVPKFLQPPAEIPQQVITVPKIPPMALSTAWDVFPMKPIQLFVLAPLPKAINVLAQKLPSVQQTFSQVGISKITDVQKLAATKLNLPGISQLIGVAPVQISPGKFAPISGIPIADLPSQIKQQIPSGIAFTRVGGGLVDVKTILSIDQQGSPQQTIETTSLALLQLAVKVDAPASKVTGYIVFGSKKPTQTAFSIPLNDLTASLTFSGPNIAKPQTQPVETENKLVLSTFQYKNTGSGVYTASVQAPAASGQYQIITVIDYQDINTASEELKLTAVVDPEGYVYEKNGVEETRIGGAVVSLYWLNPDTKQYELWPAKSFQQDNPQITDATGSYSFLVPEGYYYLKVDAPGYLSYDGEPIQVQQGSGIHVNVELKTKYWFLTIVDWKTVLLIIVILLLLYNFYQDRMRAKIAMIVSSSKAGK